MENKKVLEMIKNGAKAMAEKSTNYSSTFLWYQKKCPQQLLKKD